MKKLLFLAVFSAMALVFAGCRYSGETYFSPEPDSPEVASMSLQEAQSIITSAFSNPPTGRHPHNPGWEVLAQTTSVKCREHNRTEFYLLELKQDKKVTIRFYSYSKADAERFLIALWRIKKEYATPVPAVPAK